MDLQDFSSEMLYFEEGNQREVDELLEKAAQEYGPISEKYLLRALSMAEENLSVLVGLYRFYYYQHRYADALNIAYRVMGVVGRKIEFPSDWRDITMVSVTNGVVHSFCLVRLYFFALKAAGYISLRMAKFEQGKEMLEKVVAMDSADRMGAKLLLEVLSNNKADVLPFNQAHKLEACS